MKLLRVTLLGRDPVSQHVECQRRMLTEFTHRRSEADRVRVAAALVPALDRDLLAEQPLATSASKT